ncbi:MAG TPA: hypothetical protein VN442_19060 [Bryobacteraceae bacterium]|nr:hypothetical protein [Bryobacteraceae bacterium]
MPSKGLLIAFGAGLAAVVLMVLATFYIQRGAHIRLEGEIKKVRTAGMDEYSSVAVVDFRFANPADYPFVVRRVDVRIEDAQGNVYDGVPVSEVDAKRLFEFYKPLGQKFNDTLLMNDKIAPRTTQDRMIAARFAIPEQILQGRRSLTIQVEEVDGPMARISEQKK